MSNELKSIRIWVDISWWDEVIYTKTNEKLNWVTERFKWVLKFLEEWYEDLNLVIYSQTEDTLEKIDNILSSHHNQSISNKIKLVCSEKEKLYQHLRFALKDFNNSENLIEAFISAWDTWTLVKESLSLKRISDEELWRWITALMSFFPKIWWWETAVLDLWANIWNISKSEALIKNAVLATRYYDKYLKEDSTISLLNIWEEKNKWWTELEEAYKLLSEKFQSRFLWNIEANNILRCESDIIVTDWFTWNIALKSIEWTAKNLENIVRDEISNLWLIAKTKAKIWALLMYWLIKGVKEDFNPDKYAWAPILWINWLVLKTHWNSNSISVYYSLIKAYKNIKHDYDNKQNNILA